MAQLLHKAPTVEITRILQKDIVLWLAEEGEARASTWLNDTWSGELGNYTIAALQLQRVMFVTI
jgi:hypothetical protein